MKNKFLVLSFMILTLVLTGCGNKVKLEDYVYLKGNDVKLEDYQLENEGFELALDKEKLEKDHPDFIQQIEENYELEDLDSLILVNDYALSNFNYSIEDVENKTPIVITFKEDFDYQSLNLDSSIKVNLKNKQTKNEIKSYNEKIEGFNSELEKIEDAYLPLFNDLKELFAEYDLKIQAVTGAFLHDEKFGETYTLTDEDKLYNFEEKPVFVITKEIKDEDFPMQDNTFKSFLNKDFYTIVNEIKYQGRLPSEAVTYQHYQQDPNQEVYQKVSEGTTDVIDEVYFSSVKYSDILILNGKSYYSNEYMEEIISDNKEKYSEEKDSGIEGQPNKYSLSDHFSGMFFFSSVINPANGEEIEMELTGKASEVKVEDYVKTQYNLQEYSNFVYLANDLIFNNYNMSYKLQNLL